MRLNALSKCSGVMVSIEACTVKPAFETMMSTTPFFVPDYRGDTIEVIEVRRVGVDGGDVASDQPGGFVEQGLPTAEDKYMSAFGDKPLGDRQADTDATTADDGSLACESEHMRLLYCPLPG